MSDTLLSYFEYLRDTSKNLTNSGDLYRCLIPRFSKTLKNDVCETSISFIEKNLVARESKEGKHFLSYLMQIKKEVNRQVYLGVGYIIGSFNKKVFGSIVNIPVSFEQEDFLGGVLKFNVDFNDLSVNYDLISSLLPDYFTSDMDGTAQDILQSISKFEENLKGIKSLKEIEILTKEFIESLLSTNKNIIVDFLTKDIAHEDLADNKVKDAIINKKEWFYRHDKYHFFIADVPDAISTWKNLSSFCEEIKENSFKSYVLKEFFSNVFSVEDFAKKEIQQTIDYSDLIKNYLPINLSKNQITAINNCFNSHISYVQGPPGTGKSHTISGIILASYLMGKKVLVVAQKNNALDVVKNKIANFYDEQFSVPFIYFNKEDKLDLKNNLLSICNQGLPEKKEMDMLNFHISKTEEKLKQLNILLSKKRGSLSVALNDYSYFYEKNQDFMHKKKLVFENPIYDSSIADSVFPLKTENKLFIKEVRNIENKYFEFQCLTKYDEVKLGRLEQQFNSVFKLKNKVSFFDLIKNRLCASFLDDWFDLSWELGATEGVRSKLTDAQFIMGIRYDISNIQKEVARVQESLFKQYHKKKLFMSLLRKDENNEIQKFGKMLHWTRGDKVLEKMEQIKYDKLLNAFPIWLSEIRNIGEILPNQAELFDLVIVDEASQVNLAEILPVFYRAKHICIVGDHKQLGLNAAGLGFSLSKKFDKIIWNKYKPSNLDFDTANYRNLTITKASILDLLRSEENKETFKYVMLDEHYRSLPGLSSFNNKEFYNEELKIMTEVPSKSLVSCFSAIKVAGSKDNKTNKIEAEEVVSIIRYILGKDLPEDKNESYREKIKLNDFVPNVPTIGIISAVRDQVELIKELVEEFSEEEFSKHRLVCGTPEEFQGDEFDIVLISSTTDEDSRNNGHYSNENRFNVATSRARFFTVFVYSSVQKIPLYDKYLQHFGISGRKTISGDNILGWSYSDKKLKSTFEKLLANQLKDFIQQLNEQYGKELKIELFNQVDSCGQKNVSFVIYNPNNQQFLALEPMGIYDINNTASDYAEVCLSRFEILEKAGWKILFTPYHLWYQNGNLNVGGTKYEKEIIRLKNEIQRIIIEED
jgi:superfamily I DNA and/or RNA helicase